jgi:hypothetical protein
VSTAGSGLDSVSQRGCVRGPEGCSAGNEAGGGDDLAQLTADGVSARQRQSDFGDCGIGHELGAEAELLRRALGRAVARPERATLQFRLKVTMIEQRSYMTAEPAATRVEYKGTCSCFA